MSLLRKVPSNIHVIYQSVPLHCWFFSAFWFQIIHFLPILAHFRHFPPLRAYVAPIYTFWGNFFHKINFLSHQEPCSKKWFLAHIFETHEPILIILICRWYILSQFSPTTWVCLLFSPVSRNFFHLSEIWVLGQIPALNFVFCYR